MQKQRGRPTKQNYIPYDYEEAYQNDLSLISEAMVETMLMNGKIRSVYATKTIRSGTQFEVEIYPEFTRKSEVPASGLKKKDREAQHNLNDKNARKRFKRLANENFNSGDIWGTLTYDDQHLPQSMDEAIKNMRNFIRRVNYQRKKHSLPPAKYMYITEWEKTQGEEIRAHHHFLMDGSMTTDEVEAIWKAGRRNEVNRLDYDRNGITGLSTYLMKNPKGFRRWCASLNLRDPDERKNHQDFKGKQVRQMVQDQNSIARIMEAKYADYDFKDQRVYYNDFNGRFYIYVEMTKKDHIKDKVVDI